MTPLLLWEREENSQTLLCRQEQHRCQRQHCWPMACQLVLTVGEDTSEAWLTDFQECYGQPKKQFGIVSFPSVTFLGDKRLMNEDMDWLIFGRRLVSRVIGNQCTNWRTEDGRFLNSYDIIFLRKFKGVCAMGNRTMGRGLELAARAPSTFVIVFLI